MQREWQSSGKGLPCGEVRIQQIRSESPSWPFVRMTLRGTIRRSGAVRAAPDQSDRTQSFGRISALRFFTESTNSPASFNNWINLAMSFEPKLCVRRVSPPFLYVFDIATL